MKEIRIVFFMIIALCISVVSYANTGAYTHGKGGVLVPIKSKDLSMVSEKITIDVYECNYPHYFLYCEYKCEYYFKNTGNEQTFQLGFPIEYGYIWGGAGPRIPINPFFEDFRVRVDKEIVSQRKYLHGLNPELADVLYDEVFGFTVPFKKNEERIISVSYNTISYNIDIGGDFDIKYILKSAQTLKNPIKKADIIIQFHFPTTIGKESKPAKYLKKESKNDPFIVISYSFTDFRPDDDLDISLGSESVGEGWKFGTLDEKIELLKSANHTTGYFGLRQMIPHTSPKDSKKLYSALHDYSLTKLSDMETPDLLYGFLFYDLSKIDLGFTKTEKETFNNEIKRRAQNAFSLESGLIQDMTVGLKANPNDPDLVLYSTRALIARPFFTLEMYPDYDNHFQFENSFTGMLNDLFNQKNFITQKSSDLKILQDSYFPTIEILFAEKRDNIKDIFDFVNKIRSAYSGRKDLNYSFMFWSYYDEKIMSLVKATENKTIDPDKLFSFSKMLSLALLGGENNYNEGGVFSNNIYSRDLMRRAYYSIGNYYFNKDFEQAVKYYRTGIAYGSSSPLFDYVTMTPGGIEFFDRLYEDDRDQYKIKYVSIGEEHPWYMDLADKNCFSQDEVVGIFTPERLLRLKLEKWKSEGEANAPAYYFAFNTACAYSRLEKADDALKWLKVAIRLNGDIKKLIPTDKDLAFVREKLKSDVNMLLK